MEATASGNVTQLLRSWSQGNEAALDQLMPLVYDELHRKAHWYMRQENPGISLQTTALVNEVYLRLIDVRDVSWNDRAHFMAMCARMMRHILVDHARERNNQKRGGGAAKVELDEALMIPADNSSDPNLIALDDALKALADFAPRKARVVEMRFFGGLSVKETAAVLKVSEDTVMDDWKMAKGWLLREMRREH
ncbi:MAG TPA: sigma-70 family RNA polymerase sigma factor [Blastocatellia bacterium]|nr:sigma-70 family RNA polymerase sigma factor [Blastocatellia bacterium]